MSWMCSKTALLYEMEQKASSVKKKKIWCEISSIYRIVQFNICEFKQQTADNLLDI